MIKDNNVRITITLSKKQANWLEKTAKSRGISKSKLIKGFVSVKSREMAEWLILSKYSNNLEELIKIAKYEWIDE